jgi:hypothetical protein
MNSTAVGLTQQLDAIGTKYLASNRRLTLPGKRETENFLKKGKKLFGSNFSVNNCYRKYFGKIRTRSRFGAAGIVAACQERRVW